MNLPVPPPVAPMLAKRVDALPNGEGWIFEPKWDGFRTLVFRDGAELLLQSRDSKPMNRYFPELLEPLLGMLPERCALDGELVIAGERGLEFESLQMRIHPAASRVKMLAAEIPASLVVWDLLCLGDESLMGAAFAERRERLERCLERARPPLFVTPVTRDRAIAKDWFDRFEGAGFDGVMAKAPDGVYQPNKRVMLKVKHKRTCECVVAGFRWYKKSEGTHVGSLLLGLYDADDKLQHVGVCGAFSDKRRRELVTELTPYREGALPDHPWAGWMNEQETGSHRGQRQPGAVSRWNNAKDLSWVALRPQLVCEVTYDHMQGTRFRHTAQFVRWRSDKPPAACGYDQLDVTPAVELRTIFAGG